MERCMWGCRKQVVARAGEQMSFVAAVRQCLWQWEVNGVDGKGKQLGSSDVGSGGPARHHREANVLVWWAGWQGCRGARRWQRGENAQVWGRNQWRRELGSPDPGEGATRQWWHRQG